MRWMLAALALGACSSDPLLTDAGESDAGAGDAAVMRSRPDAPVAPSPPAAAPARPVFVPCPAGWREVAGDPITCDPWPETSAETCAPHEAHFPGEPGCTTIGAPCPAGEWPEHIPATARVKYVKAGAPAGGDGSQSAPFATFAEALPRTFDGTIFAIARGRYDEELIIRGSRITLWGACAAETTLTTSSFEENYGVVTTVTFEGLVLRDLTIEAPRRAGIVGVYPSASIHLEGVIVRGGDQFGILSLGAPITVESSAIFDSAFAGIAIYEGATASVHRAVIARSAAFGLTANEPDTRFVLEDVAIRDSANGLRLQEHATGEARRVVFDRNQSSHLSVDTGTSMSITDSVLRDIDRPLEERPLGAILTSSSSTLAISRVTITNAVRNGLLLEGTTTAADLVVRGAQVGMAVTGSLVAERIQIEDTQVGIFIPGSANLADVIVERADAARSSGAFTVGYGGRVVLTRSRLAQSAMGVLVGHDGSLIAEDLEIDGTTRSNSYGIIFLDRAHGSIDRASIRSARGTAIGAGPDSEATFRDITIQGTQSSTAANAPLGAFAHHPRRLSLERIAIDDSFGTGVLVAGGKVELTDISIRALRDDPTRPSAHALDAGFGASVSVLRGLFTAPESLGVAAFDPGTDISLRDVVIEKTSDAKCTAGCSGMPAGVGITAVTGAHVSLERFVIDANGLCGLQIAADGTADLANGEISRNPIGVNVLTEGFDLMRVTPADVFYSDNGDDYQSRELPLPDPIPPPEIPPTPAGD